MRTNFALVFFSLWLVACSDDEKLEELEEEIEELSDELKEATAKGEVVCERVYEDYPFEGWSSSRVENFFERRTPGGTLMPVVSTSRYNRGEIEALYYCYSEAKTKKKSRRVRASGTATGKAPVSYTHLTLPTIYSV